MLDHERPQEVYLMGAESMRLREADRFEPKLGDIVAVLDMDMRRLRALQAVEEETEAAKLLASLDPVDTIGS